MQLLPLGGILGVRPPRPGFEFLPMPRWRNDPKLEEMKAALGREYLHTWAIPTYTLGMALG